MPTGQCHPYNYLFRDRELAMAWGYHSGGQNPMADNELTDDPVCLLDVSRFCIQHVHLECRAPIGGKSISPSNKRRSTQSWSTYITSTHVD